MRERPILFSAPMVRALLVGTKTQTRRIVKPSSRAADGVGVYTQDGRGIVEVVNTFEGEPIDAPALVCPYGVPGDRLWVREAWHPCATGSSPNWFSRHVAYAADNDGIGPLDGACCHELPKPVEWTGHQWGRWHAARFMPRWASRIALEITSVRCERLQDVSEADARAEGVEPMGGLLPGPGPMWWRDYLGGCGYPSARDSFASLWRAINGAESWDASPWVWAVSFRRLEERA